MGVPSLAGQVTGRLRRMILVGELAAGQRTTQDALAQLLGVSITPVRQALLRLAAEAKSEAAVEDLFNQVLRLTR